MKRPNLRIIRTEEGEEIQVKDTENILNKIIEEKNSQPKEGDAYKGARSIQNTKQTGPEKITKEKSLSTHNNQMKELTKKSTI